MANRSDRDNHISRYPSPFRLLFLVFVATFFIEITFMLTLHSAFTSPFYVALLDASTLVLLNTPILYFLIYRPFVEHIEGRKKAEKDLRESEAKFHQIFQQATDYILLLEPVIGGPPIITDASDSAFTMHGYTREEMIGKPITFLDKDLSSSEVQKRMQTVESGGLAQFEVEHKRKDGSTFFADVSAKLISSGGKRIILSLERDITEKIQLQKTLRDSEELFRTAFEHSKVGMNVLDGNYKFQKVNKAFCEMIGYSEAELLKNDFIHITHPDDIEPNLSLSKRILAGEIDFFHLEKRYVSKQGEIVWGDLTVSAVRDSDKTLIYVVALIQDITDRKKSVEELIQAKESAENATMLKDKFLSIVSHDLKGPLSTMLGFLKLVRSEKAEPLNEGAKLILDNSLQVGKQMTQLIDDLLNVSRFKTGQIKLQQVFFDAKYLGSKVVAGYEHMAKDKGVLLKNEIPEKTRIYGDKILLLEAIGNLVTNAIKFCGRGDSVTIGMTSSDDWALCVKDTGRGMSQEQMEKLLKQDVKKSSVGTAGEIGTGLGLTLVKDIMFLHGGSLDGASEPDAGSCFRLHLPYIKPRILIVDDDSKTRLLYRNIFQDMDTTMDLLEAGNGIVAMEIIFSEQPHLVLADIEMPEMSGLDLLEKIKNSQATQHIPVIIMTGKHGKEIQDTVFKLGADDFITKSGDLNEFYFRIRKFIG